VAENDKLTSDPESDPIRKLPGEYRDDVESIPEADRTQESSLPKGKDPSPFRVGPMSSGGR
jgi:hypothetical protein